MARATQFGPSIRQKFSVGSWEVCTKIRRRMVWECRGRIRDGARRNAAKPCDTCDCGISANISVRRKQQYSFSASQPQHPCCCVACRPPRRGSIPEQHSHASAWPMSLSFVRSMVVQSTESEPYQLSYTRYKLPPLKRWHGLSHYLLDMRQHYCKHLPKASAALYR